MNELNVGSERMPLRFKMGFPVWSIILGPLGGVGGGAEELHQNKLG